MRFPRMSSLSIRSTVGMSSATIIIFTRSLPSTSVQWCTGSTSATRSRIETNGTMNCPIPWFGWSLSEAEKDEGDAKRTSFKFNIRHILPNETNVFKSIGLLDEPVDKYGKVLYNIDISRKGIVWHRGLLLQTMEFAERKRHFTKRNSKQNRRILCYACENA